MEFRDESTHRNITSLSETSAAVQVNASPSIQMYARARIYNEILRIGGQQVPDPKWVGRAVDDKILASGLRGSTQ